MIAMPSAQITVATPARVALRVRAFHLATLRAIHLPRANGIPTIARSLDRRIVGYSSSSQLLVYVIEAIV